MQVRKWVDWDVRFFYRRWQGWRRILWWLWPSRWAVVTDFGGGMKSWDYYPTLRDATKSFYRQCSEDRNACISELEQERDAAYARGVEDGIERVRELAIGKSDGWADHPAERLCDIALAAFEQEQEQNDE